MDKYEAIKVLTEKVAKLLPYKIDVDVKLTDKEDEVEVIWTRCYQKPIKRIKIEMELKN